MGHASRSSGLFCVKAGRGRISQSDLNIGECVMASGACGTIAEVT
jgi:hypothetical protein